MGLTVRETSRLSLTGIHSIYMHYAKNTFATFAYETDACASLDTWEKMFDTREDMAWLEARDDGELVGFGYIGQFREKAGWRFSVEDTIYVKPGHGGKGIGRLLLQGLMERAKKAGFMRCVAMISCPPRDDLGGDKNKYENDWSAVPSLKLHRALGFVDIGKLNKVGFKFDTWLDTCVLEKDLTTLD